MNDGTKIFLSSYSFHASNSPLILGIHFAWGKFIREASVAPQPFSVQCFKMATPGLAS